MIGVRSDRFGQVDILIHSQPVWFDDNRILFVSQGAAKLANVARAQSSKMAGSSV